MDFRQTIRMDFTVGVFSKGHEITNEIGVRKKQAKMAWKISLRTGRPRLQL
jgi:hypothetical protein